ncbi:response regulator transcription factor [bacterium]|nr:response regulator transcription factor [bacterium]
MKIIIIEDEFGASENLKALIQEIDENIEIIARLESIAESIEWIKSNPEPDLAFIDIQLTDGKSFKIFDSISADFPIIFTTAYNQFAIDAFKLNSVDYLLKPINKNELKNALDKFNKLYQNQSFQVDANIKKLLEEYDYKERQYQQSFLINQNNRMIPIKVDTIVLFYSKNELVHCLTNQNEKYLVDFSLNEIEQRIDPKNIFRANRQFIVSRKFIKSIEKLFNGKLNVTISIKTNHKISVSKAKAHLFKQWLSY